MAGALSASSNQREEYREAQLELDNQIAGVSSYNPWNSEPVPISIPESVDPHPFPFSTKDPEHIGNHLIAMGHILRIFNETHPKARTVLEYGCGIGFTTIFLAASGYDVTAVDINAEALAVLDVLAQTRRLTVT